MTLKDDTVTLKDDNEQNKCM